MIQILKYIFFLVLGIIIFVLYSNVDNFSVGISYLQLGHPDNPTELNTYGPDTDLFFTVEDNVNTEDQNIFYFDLSTYGLVILPGQNILTITDDIIDRIIEDNQDNPNIEIIRDILNRIRGNNRLPFTDNRNLGGGLGSPPDLPAPRPGGRGGEDTGGGGGGGGMSGGGGIGSSVVQALSDLLISSGNECATSFEKPKTCSDMNGVSKTRLESFGYVFNMLHTIVVDGITYKLYFIDSTNVKRSDKDSIIKIYREMNDPEPNMAVLPKTNGDKLYYLSRVSNTEEVIVSRMENYYGELVDFVACKLSLGYGSLLMRSLAEFNCLNPTSEHKVYLSYIEAIDGSYKAYRILFKLSVTDFLEGCDNIFSIFEPDDDTILTIYQLDVSLNIFAGENKRKYLAFLMKYHDDLLRYYLNKKGISDDLIKEIFNNKEYSETYDIVNIFNDLLFNLDDSNPLKDSILQNIDNPEALAQLFKDHFDTL